LHVALCGDFLKRIFVVFCVTSQLSAAAATAAPVKEVVLAVVVAAAGAARRQGAPKDLQEKKA